MSKLLLLKLLGIAIVADIEVTRSAAVNLISMHFTNVAIDVMHVRAVGI